MGAIAEQQFVFNGYQISFQKFGTGSTILLAFHGFGQSSQAYEALDGWQGGRCTVFAIDLFFHGSTLPPTKPLLGKADWHRLLTAFLATYQINRFSVVGFSLGGRFALITVEAFADRLDQLLLVAPDGITQHFWYQMATRSAVGRRLFRCTLDHLSFLNGLGHVLERLGLLNRSVMRFVTLSLSTPQQRKLVYQSWTRFRLLQPNLLLISQLLNTHPIQVYFFTGAFDRLVPGLYVLPLAKRLKDYSLLTVRSGHNHLIELMSRWNPDCPGRV